MKASVFYFLLLSINFAQTLNITSPKNNSIFKLEDDLELEWESDGFSEQTQISIDYKIIGQANWTNLKEMSVGEEAHIIELEDELRLKSGSSINAEGEIAISIHKGNRYREIVNIKIPELSTHGNVKFVNGNKGIKNNDISITYDGNNRAEIGDVISLKFGKKYSFTAKVDEYGSVSGTFFIDPGKTKTVEIEIKKTWGEVIFTSKKDEDFRIQIKRRTSPFKKESLKQFDAKKISVDLEKGEYVFSALKAHYKLYTKKFTIDPNKTITIPIKLVPKYAKVRFTTTTDNVEIFLSTEYNKRRFSNTELRLPEGKQIIVAQKNGFRETTMEVNLDPFKALNEFEIKMVREHGSIEISSKPPGAEILIDRKPINEKTPFTVDSISVDQHGVSVNLKGYREQSIKTNTNNLEKYISDGKKLDLFFPLERKVGNLYIDKRTPKQKIEVLVDNKPINLKNVKQTRESFKFEVPEGKHVIQINEKGYEQIEETIYLKDRGAKFIKAIGKPILVNIFLRPSPLGARMTLYTNDNQEYNNMDITGKKNDFKLPYGSYKIKAKAPKYEMGIVKRTVDSPGPYTIQVNLKKKTPEKALKLSVFPGAGLIYADKQKLGISVMASTLGLGSYYVFLRGKYPKEIKKLNVLQADYLENTDLDEFAIKKARRDDQQEKVKKIKDMKDFSKYATVVLYGVNLSLSWKFHGL